VAAFQAEAQDRLPWERMREWMVSGLAALPTPISLDDLRGIHVLNTTPIGVLPASTPYAVVSVTEESAELEDGQRQWLQVRIWRGDSVGGSLLLDQRVALSSMASPRVSLAYQPATVEDQQLANRSGGMGGFPAYLIRLRPTLLVDGHP